MTRRIVRQPIVRQRSVRHRTVRQRTVRHAAACAAALLVLAARPLAAQQTLGPVTLSGGFGVGYQPRNEFTIVGPHLWVGAESVLDQRLRVRLDLGVHYFPYTSPPIPPCPATTYCAPVVTKPLEIGAITGTIVWRDSTGVRRWYWMAGLGAYSALGGRDANSRLGLTGGIGRELGVTRSYFIEARVHLPYDGNGYGVFVPITAGWHFGHFTP